ncbi:hypothetical protein BCEP4_510011 [Burkholderia cepacia]|nr:hypothetical protein BCEP4_510011 [Burkholderia cepacia]
MKVAHPSLTITSAPGKTSPYPFAVAAKTVRSRHVAQYFPFSRVSGFVLNRRLDSLFDQKTIALLCSRNPLRRPVRGMSKVSAIPYHKP